MTAIVRTKHILICISCDVQSNSGRAAGQRLAVSILQRNKMFLRLVIWPTKRGESDEDQPGSLFSRAFSITTGCLSILSF